MKLKEDEIKNAFWKSVEKQKYTWEELNRGKEIKFTYKGKEYIVNSRLGEFWSLAIDSYARVLEQRALNCVLEDLK